MVSLGYFISSFWISASLPPNYEVIRCFAGSPLLKCSQFLCHISFECPLLLLPLSHNNPTSFSKEKAGSSRHTERLQPTGPGINRPLGGKPSKPKSLNWWDIDVWSENRAVRWGLKTGQELILGAKGVKCRDKVEWGLKIQPDSHQCCLIQACSAKVNF